MVKRVHYSHHYSHRGLRKHKLSPIARFSVYIIVPLILVTLSIFIGSKFFSVKSFLSLGDIFFLFNCLLASFLRLSGAYILALIFGILLSIFAISSKKLESVLLPLYDILESVPILVFFPIIIIFFISYQFFNTAAIFIIFLNMLWNIVFSCIAGLRLIPEDIIGVGKVFRLSAIQRFWKITLPSLFPYLVTGSLLAWAEGWNMLIVAEVLKTYVPSGLHVSNLYGIGSALVEASVSGNSKLFFGSVFFIVLAVIVINIFVWQPLLRKSEKYKFEN